MTSRHDGIFSPTPRRWTVLPGTAVAQCGSSEIRFFAGDVADLLPAERKLRAVLGENWRFAVNPAADGPRPEFVFSLRIAPGSGRSESYRLCVRRDGVELEASDRGGLFYAVQRLISICCCDAESGRVKMELPLGEIEDWPDFPVRGVMLDVSRGKIPQMSTLYGLVDLLSELRYNHLQLYFENAFAYPGHEAAWRGTVPFTAEQIVELERYCGERCIELSANQNLFGHMERWLERPEYASLAELPQGGAPLPWGGTRSYPSALCPSDARVLPFVKSLLDSLLPCFSSGLVNIGFDEVFDLCRGSRSVGDDDSPARVTGIWLAYLDKVAGLVRGHGKVPLYWADMIHRHPESIPSLPKDAVALEWGYEADHPFEERTGHLQQAGIPFWVCPGTSSWRSIAGRTSNMKANLIAAARAGLAHGAGGFLLADWGDAGHTQGLCVSYPAFVYGGLVSWNGAAHEGVDLAGAIAGYALNYGTARDLLAAGDLYLHCGRQQSNSTALFDMMRSEIAEELPVGVSAETLAQVAQRLAGLFRPEDVAGLQAADAGEIELLRRLLFMVCQKANWRDTPQRWDDEREMLTKELERVWNMRARPADLSRALRRGGRE